jgi:branched-chain amino acid transport system substrate-binding protein
MKHGKEHYSGGRRGPMIGSVSSSRFYLLSVPCFIRVSSVAMLALFLAGCGNREPKKEYIGLTVALTGPQQKAGEEIRRGAELALEDFDQELGDGLIAGRKLVLLSNDTTSKPERTKAMAVRMIHANKVIALIGGDAGPSDHEAAWVCQNSPAPQTTPFVSAASSDPRLTQLGSFVFQAGLSEEARGRALAAFAIKELKAERIAILHLVEPTVEKPEAEATRNGTVESFVSALAAALKGKTIHTHRGKIEELKSVMETWKGNDRPDAVVLAGSSDSLLRSSTFLPSKDLPVLAGGCGEPELLLQANPGGVAGWHFAASFSAEDPDSAGFVKRFEAKHQTKPSALAALGHDATRMLLQAVKDANSMDRVKIRDRLAAIDSFQGASGSVSWTENRTARRPALIVHFTNGNSKLVKKLPADGY